MTGARSAPPGGSTYAEMRLTTVPRATTRSFSSRASTATTAVTWSECSNSVENVMRPAPATPYITLSCVVTPTPTELSLRRATAAVATASKIAAVHAPWSAPAGLATLRGWLSTNLWQRTCRVAFACNVLHVRRCLASRWAPHEPHGAFVRAPQAGDPQQHVEALQHK